MTRRDRILKNISKAYDENFALRDEYWVKNHMYKQSDGTLSKTRKTKTVVIVHPDEDSTYWDSLVAEENKLFWMRVTVAGQPDFCLNGDCEAISIGTNNKNNVIRRLSISKCNHMARQKTCPLLNSVFEEAYR